MTDSVAKNLTVEELVSEELETDLFPKHALCKSHVVEKLDCSNLEVLAEAESKINLRPKMEAYLPGIKGYTRRCTSLVECGIKNYYYLHLPLEICKPH